MQGILFNLYPFFLVGVGVSDLRRIIELSSCNFEILLRNEGFAPHVARGGREGLSRLASLSPDIVVSDVRMPDVSGVEVLAAARAELVVLRAALLPAPRAQVHVRERHAGDLGQHREGFLAPPTHGLGVDRCRRLVLLHEEPALAGFIAVLSVTLNILIVLGVLASLGATLTMPGIAGMSISRATSSSVR